MNTTPENVPDETLLQAKVVRAQLLIKTNTRNIVRRSPTDPFNRFRDTNNANWGI